LPFSCCSKLPLPLSHRSRNLFSFLPNVQAIFAPFSPFQANLNPLSLFHAISFLPFPSTYLCSFLTIKSCLFPSLTISAKSSTFSPIFFQDASSLPSAFQRSLPLSQYSEQPHPLPRNFSELFPFSLFRSAFCPPSPFQPALPLFHYFELPCPLPHHVSQLFCSESLLFHPSPFQGIHLSIFQATLPHLLNTIALHLLPLYLYNIHLDLVRLLVFLSGPACFKF
jgi:hypothetical protein